MGIQGGRAHGIKTQELFKIKANRLVSGVLIINVRHDDPDATGNNEFDVNQAFASTNDSSSGITLDGWKLAGTNVSSSGGSLWSSDAGQYPYRGARPNFKNASDAGLSTAVSASDQGFAIEREISAFTKAAPGVITVSGGHFFVNGDTVRIQNVGGSSDWEQLNGNVYQVLNVSNETLQLGNATDNVYDSGVGSNLVDTNGFSGNYDTLDMGVLVGVENRRYYASVDSWSSDSDGATATATSTVKSKKLSLGDYDSFCYYVSAALSTSAPYFTSGTRRHRIASNEYYFSKPPSHDACQSFVKSHLISRINNSARTNYEDMLLGQHSDSVPLNETSGDNADVKQGMMKGGMRRVKYTIPESHGAGRFQADDKDIDIKSWQSTTSNNDMRSKLSDQNTLGMNCDLSEEEYLFNNGVYSHTSGFGLDLNDRKKSGSFKREGEDNNNFFTPVYDVDIYAYHPCTFTTHTTNKAAANLPANSDINASTTPGTWYAYSSDGNLSAGHSEDYWYLAVDVYHWAYVENDGSSYPERMYCPVNVEIVWQPYGETSELEIT